MSAPMLQQQAPSNDPKFPMAARQEPMYQGGYLEQSYGPLPGAQPGASAPEAQDPQTYPLDPSPELGKRAPRGRKRRTPPPKSGDAASVHPRPPPPPPQFTFANNDQGQQPGYSLEPGIQAYNSAPGMDDGNGTDAATVAPTSPGGSVLGAAGRAVNPSKRAEQNRKAQRAFRERRDAHVKDLEHRSTMLDSALADLAEQTRRFEECRHMVDTLRSENQRLSAALQQYTGGQLPPGFAQQPQLQYSSGPSQQPQAVGSAPPPAGSAQNGSSVVSGENETQGQVPIEENNGGEQS